MKAEIISLLSHLSHVNSSNQAAIESNRTERASEQDPAAVVRLSVKPIVMSINKLPMLPTNISKNYKNGKNKKVLFL